MSIIKFEYGLYNPLNYMVSKWINVEQNILMHTGITYEHIHIYKDNLNINLLSFVPFVSPSSFYILFLHYNTTELKHFKILFATSSLKHMKINLK